MEGIVLRFGPIVLPLLWTPYRFHKPAYASQKVNHNIIHHVFMHHNCIVWIFVVHL